jgi:hypothetical protein
MGASLFPIIVIELNHLTVLVDVHVILMLTVILQSSALIMVLSHASTKLSFQSILQKAPHQMFLRYEFGPTSAQILISLLFSYSLFSLSVYSYTAGDTMQRVSDMNEKMA